MTQEEQDVERILETAVSCLTRLDDGHIHHDPLYELDVTMQEICKIHRDVGCTAIRRGDIQLTSIPVNYNFHIRVDVSHPTHQQFVQGQVRLTPLNDGWLIHHSRIQRSWIPEIYRERWYHMQCIQRAQRALDQAWYRTRSPDPPALALAFSELQYTVCNLWDYCRWHHPEVQPDVFGLGMLPAMLDRDYRTMVRYRQDGHVLKIEFWYNHKRRATCEIPLEVPTLHIFHSLT